MENLREMLDKLFNENNVIQSKISPVIINWGKLEKLEIAYPVKVEQNFEEKINLNQETIDLMIVFDTSYNMFDFISNLSEEEMGSVLGLNQSPAEVKKGIQATRQMEYYFFHRMPYKKRISLMAGVSGLGEEIWKNIARNDEGKELAAWRDNVLYVTVKL